MHEIDQFTAGVETKIDFRIFLVEVSQSRQQPLLQERAEQADIEQAAGAILAQMVDGADEFAQTTLHAGQESSALRGESHRAAVAYKQRSFEKLFERFDMRTDSGGGDVQRARGVSEAQMSR